MKKQNISKVEALLLNLPHAKKLPKDHFLTYNIVPTP
jgi:hypothetical protein